VSRFAIAPRQYYQVVPHLATMMTRKTRLYLTF